MPNDLKTITVRPDSEFADLLEHAPLRLEKNGVRYQLHREDTAEDPWAAYDPEATRAGLRAMAGSITADDAQRIKALIYRGREEGTRPLERP